MENFQKSQKLNNVHYEIRGKVMNEACKMEKENIDILKLNIGNPATFNFKAPNYVVSNITQNMNLAEGYSESKGIEEARISIVKYFESKNIFNINSNDIYLGNGVSELILMSIQALLNPGDEILIPAPGLSKSDMIAGYRIGWMCISGNKEKAKDYIEGLNLLSSMRLCPNVPAQYAVTKALENTEYIKTFLKPGGRIYNQREIVYNALNNIDGVSVVKPKAAFYIFPKIDINKFNIKSDEKFALDLLHQEKILIVHGTGLNWNEPDHFRLVYLPEEKILKTAMTRMNHFFENYKQ